MRRLIACIAFLLFAAGSVSAQKDTLMRSGIIYGKNHAYSLTAPDGWVLDNTSGVSQGLYAVFYPEGSSWKDAETVMYTRGLALDSVERTCIDSVVNYDIRYFRENEPGIEVNEVTSQRISKDKVARMVSFGGGSYNNYEMVAYIPEEKVVVEVVLTSRTEKGMKENLPKLNELLSSYLFISENVEIKTH